MSEYCLKKFKFITPTLEGSRLNTTTVDYTNSYIGGGQYSNITHNPPQPRQYYSAEDYTVCRPFTNEITHLPREEALLFMKRQMVEEIADHIFRDGMYMFFESVDPETLGVNVTCKLKVVRPPQNNITGRHNP